MVTYLLVYTCTCIYSLEAALYGRYRLAFWNAFTGVLWPTKSTCKQRRRDKARHEQGQVGIAFPDPKLLGGSYEAATTRAGARRAL